MTTEDYMLLLYKQLDGDISPEDTAKLAAWRATDPAHELDARAVELAWQKTAPRQIDTAALDLDQAFAELEAKMPTAAAPKADTPVRQLPRRRWWAMAAGFLLLLGGAWWMLQSNGGGTVTPGEWKLAEATKAAETVTLPDGSTVTLQMNSSLRYPAKFPRNERRVELKGEGFFEVEKQPKKPFIVSTAAEEVTVLGTSFLVKEMPIQQATVVYVASGKVAVANKATDAGVELTAGQGAVSHQQEGTIKMAPEANANLLAWQNGVLRFEQTSLRVAIQAIENTFGYSFELTNPALAKCTIDNQFDRSDPARFANDIATIFGGKAQQVGSFKFKIIGGNCK